MEGDQVPEAVWLNILVPPDDKAKVQKKKSRKKQMKDGGSVVPAADDDDDFDDGDSKDSEPVLRSSAVLDVECKSLGNKKRREAAQVAYNVRLAQSMERTPPVDAAEPGSTTNSEEPLSSPLTDGVEKVLAMPSGSIVSHQHHPEFFYLTFPDLFPFGKGAPNVRRAPHIAIDKTAPHYFHLADPRFRQHAIFRFLLFNVVQRHRVSQATWSRFATAQTSTTGPPSGRATESFKSATRAIAFGT